VGLLRRARISGIRRAKIYGTDIYVFWYWFAGDGFRSPGSLYWGPLYGQPFGMVLGFFALLVWGLYAYRTREDLLGVVPSGTSKHVVDAS
jgi:hypothetical protein